MHFRPTHPGDRCAVEQIKLRARRLLLLVLRGGDVPQVLDPAQRGAAARGGTLRARGRARALVLGAVPGAGGCGRAAPFLTRTPSAARRSAPHSTCRTISDSLDSIHASSESARFEVIVLR